jgi:hypothetical protein
MKPQLAGRSSATPAFNKKRNIPEDYMNGHMNNVGWPFMVFSLLLTHSLPT